MRRYQAYSDVIAAVARIHSTLGIRIISSEDFAGNLDGLTQAVGKAMKDWMDGSAINAEVERLEALQPKETHVVKSSDGGDVYAAVTPKVDKPLSRELVEVEPVVVVLPGQQLTAELASDPAPVLVATGAGQPSEETETLAVNLQKGELENDIYFVIGSSAIMLTRSVLLTSIRRCCRLYSPRICAIEPFTGSSSGR